MIQSNKKGEFLNRFSLVLKWILSIWLLLLLGCAKPSYKTQKSALILIKAPNLKYADMGFIYQGEESTKVEIYSSAQPIFVLNIYANSICMDKFKCLEPSSFNEQFLTSYYPKSFLANIFNQKPIFDAKNLTQAPHGFNQRIKGENIDIEYSVIGDKLLFRDRANSVVIKISGQ